jgi:acylphosphatase
MIKAIFYGHVQGVGFRYTAKRFAEKIKAKGYVKNLDDGTVELVTDKQELIEMLKNYFKGYVKDIKTEKLERYDKKTYDDFKIIF